MRSLRHVSEGGAIYKVVTLDVAELRDISLGGVL